MADRPTAPGYVAPGPYVTMPGERWTVSISALGNERHRVLVEGGLNVDRVIEGQRAAHDLAHRLARGLREGTYGAKG